MRSVRHGLLPLTAVFFLCACAPFKFGDKRAGLCNQLNSQVIFSGNRYNTRTAEIQYAAVPLAQREYDSHCTQ
jgi:hypothetical protein